MGKIRINEIMVNNSATFQNPQSQLLNGRIVSVAVRNSATSGNNLCVGWNEDPSAKNQLSQAESVGYGPFSTGQYIDGMELRVGFDGNDPNNRGLVTIATEIDEEVC